MKKLNFVKLLAATGLLVLSTAAWSFTINGGATDVGGFDDLLAQTSLPNSGQQTETDWVNQVLQSNSYAVTTWSTKNDSPNPIMVDGGMNDIYAIGLSTQPDYFLLKFGNAGGSFSADYLFKNVYSLDYAVFQLSALAPEGTSFNIGMVSHVSEFGGTTQTVPEPGSIALLGLGLIGLGLMSRRAKKV